MKKWYIVQYTIDTIIKADDPLDALVNIQEIASEDLGSRIDDIVWEASKEEIAIAEAVFFPNGSNIIDLGLIFISRICSAAINLCCSLQIIIGFSIF